MAPHAPAPVVTTAAQAEAWQADLNELAELWSRLAGQHVSLGSACACSVGGVTLQLADFEQDIIDYAIGQAEQARRDDLAAWLQRHGREGAREDGAWRVSALLEALDRVLQQGRALAGEGAPADLLPFTLARLGQTLRSFARLHG
ncbi:hypothetical protein [Ideonella livida]|uniref:Uncharacterized protein n=1 Tax=Ideonella livida TaxID=2707176 RepID=A0A7C9TKF3_9BURK|nr:hypothetical protein [Ideonella livida]NDY92438.1 hypothetical protein [Ideonella livida]